MQTVAVNPILDNLPNNAGYSVNRPRSGHARSKTPDRDHSGTMTPQLLLDPKHQPHVNVPGSGRGRISVLEKKVFGVHGHLKPNPPVGSPGSKLASPTARVLTPSKGSSVYKAIFAKNDLSPYLASAPNAVGNHTSRARSRSREPGRREETIVGDASERVYQRAMAEREKEKKRKERSRSRSQSPSKDVPGTGTDGFHVDESGRTGPTLGVEWMRAGQPPPRSSPQRERLLQAFENPEPEPEVRKGTLFDNLRNAWIDAIRPPLDPLRHKRGRTAVISNSRAPPVARHPVSETPANVRAQFKVAEQQADLKQNSLNPRGRSEERTRENGLAERQRSRESSRGRSHGRNSLDNYGTGEVRSREGSREGVQRSSNGQNVTPTREVVSLLSSPRAFSHDNDVVRQAMELYELEMDQLHADPHGPTRQALKAMCAGAVKKSISPGGSPTANSVNGSPILRNNSPERRNESAGTSPPSQSGRRALLELEKQHDSEDIHNYKNAHRAVLTSGGNTTASHGAQLLRKLQKERMLYAKNGFVEQAEAVDVRIKAVQAQMENAAAARESELLKEHLAALDVKQAHRRQQLELELRLRWGELQSEQVGEYDRLKERQRSDFLHAIESVELAAVGGGRKCNCRGWYLCRHNSMRSTANTRISPKDVAKMIKNSDLLCSVGKWEDARKWEEQAKALDAAHQQEWSSKVAKTLVLSDWNAGAPVLDKLIKQQKLDLEMLSKNQETERAVVMMRFKRRREMLATSLAAERARAPANVRHLIKERDERDREELRLRQQAAKELENDPEFLELQRLQEEMDTIREKHEQSSNQMAIEQNDAILRLQDLQREELEQQSPHRIDDTRYRHAQEQAKLQQQLDEEMRILIEQQEGEKRHLQLESELRELEAGDGSTELQDQEGLHDSEFRLLEMEGLDEQYAQLQIAENPVDILSSNKDGFAINLNSNTMQTLNEPIDAIASPVSRQRNTADKHSKNDVSPNHDHHGPVLKPMRTSFIMRGIENLNKAAAIAAQNEATQAEERLAVLMEEQRDAVQELESDLRAVMEIATNSGFVINQRRQSTVGKVVLPFVLEPRVSQHASVGSKVTEGEARDLEVHLATVVSEQERLYNKRNAEIAAMVERMAKRGFTINHEHHRPILQPMRTSFILNGIAALNRPPTVDESDVNALIAESDAIRAKSADSGHSASHKQAVSASVVDDGDDLIPQEDDLDAARAEVRSQQSHIGRVSSSRESPVIIQASKQATSVPQPLDDDNDLIPQDEDLDVSSLAARPSSSARPSSGARPSSTASESGSGKLIRGLSGLGSKLVHGLSKVFAKDDSVQSQDVRPQEFSLEPSDTEANSNHILSSQPADELNSATLAKKNKKAAKEHRHRDETRPKSRERSEDRDSTLSKEERRLAKEARREKREAKKREEGGLEDEDHLHGDDHERPLSKEERRAARKALKAEETDHTEDHERSLSKEERRAARKALKAEETDHTEDHERSLSKEERRAARKALKAEHASEMEHDASINSRPGSAASAGGRPGSGSLATSTNTGRGSVVDVPFAQQDNSGGGVMLLPPTYEELQRMALAEARLARGVTEKESKKKKKEKSKRMPDASDESDSTSVDDHRKHRKHKDRTK